MSEKEKKVFVFKGKIIETRGELLSLLLVYSFVALLVGPFMVVLSVILTDKLHFSEVMKKYGLEIPGVVFLTLSILFSVFAWWVLVILAIGWIMNLGGGS